MADASGNFAIRQFVVQPGVATPIIPPIACTQIVLENQSPTNSFTVYTDPATAASIAQTTKTVPAGVELTLRASVLAFGANAPVCFVTCGVADAVIVATFLR